MFDYDILELLSNIRATRILELNAHPRENAGLRIDGIAARAFSNELY